MGLAGNTDRDVRKFCREMGMKPNVANVERVGREVRRTQQENERLDATAKERGVDGTRDRHGPVEGRVREHVARQMAERDRQQRGR